MLASQLDESLDDIEGSTGEHRADVANAHVMVSMQASWIKEPIDLWMIIASISEFLKTLGKTLGKHTIIIVPKSNETALSKSNPPH